MRKITETDLAGKGNLGRPDIPGVSTAEMQRILDELSREVIVPAFNELSGQVETAVNERYTKEEADKKLNEKAFEIGAGDMTKSVYDPGNDGVNVTVQTWNCVKSGTVYYLAGSGTTGRCKIPEAWTSGDTFSVNGNVVPAYCGADAVDGDTIVAGRWVLFTYDGTQLNFSGGGGLGLSKLAKATAAADNVLAGKSFYAVDKTLKEGTMPNRGAVDTTINPGSSYAVPAGYHNGGGRVKAATWTKDKYLYLVIQYQNGYGNPIPEYAATVVAQGIPEPGFLAHYIGGGNVNAVKNVCNANMLNIEAYAGNGTAQITPLTYLYDIFHKTNHDPGVVYTLGAGVYCYRMR